ncbi:MAG: hypothetical protein AAB421_01055 [Patescibacteria group bacterium]
MRKNPQEFDWGTVGLNFGNWDEKKIWALNIPESTLDISELEWHLDCPFWENDSGVEYSVTPREVLEKISGTTNEQEKVENADTKHPIDIYFNKNKWLVLDGIHRLAKLYAAGAERVRVRIITADTLPLVSTGEPIEMPTWWNKS